jgi:hypothetical protein
VSDDEALAYLVDDLESRADRYLLLTEVEKAAGRDLSDAVTRGLLLVDQRLQLDPDTGDTRPVRLCRLNRHHPAARALGGWGGT